MALVPVCAYREFFGFGKIKARDVSLEGEKGLLAMMLSNCSKDEEVWAVMSWKRFEDGHEEEGLMNLLFAGATEKDARKAMARMIRFHRMSKDELVELSECFEAKKEDLAYIENRFPDFQAPVAGPGAMEANDLYQARLKVLAGLQPKTVNLIRQADAADEPERRRKLEREAVDAYFAELAPDWTEDQVLAWQRNNPVGTEWMCEFARVIQEPERRVDPVNYELAFNWLRRKYNLLTAEELSDMILIATGQRLMPGTLKKRRERMGLMTDRDPGPRPKSEQ
jgi:hypothetical protein